ncbi:tetratricopeptide repeat protein [Salaquimonas pukyongi]|uniref:tetratricopeptide repeat protein n=1 Tax=Salaquimonas pukyongi TaxID=2712698 RepID=UPI00096B865C|nr:tetratricopeptide repeat protein [Salaquimonas pukyongi]
MLFEINRKSSIVMMLAATLALSACATDKTRTGSIKRSSASMSELSVPELNRAIESYGKQYERRPKSKQAGLNYADALRTAGRTDQALAVMQQMVIHHPDDNDVLAAYGKALASNGELKKALEVIGRAQHDDRPDWRLLSAQGAVLDQLDRPQEARVYYQKALQIVPDEPSVLSNLGMSYLLTNELPKAEQYLKMAVGTRKADSRVRQNLALVVGLQGRFEEAERIAAAEMSPTDAKANVDYLRQMLSQQNAWNILKEDDKGTN